MVGQARFAGAVDIARQIETAQLVPPNCASSRLKNSLERVLQSKLYLPIVGRCVGDGRPAGHVHSDLGTAAG